MHIAICSIDEKGVAMPIQNSDTGTRRLIRYETGTRTQNALTMPWAMTKRVRPRPLKKPMAQKNIGVSRQSMP